MNKRVTLETVASRPGARTSPGNSSRKSGSDAARAAVSASFRGAVRSTRIKSSRSSVLCRARVCAAGRKADRPVGRRTARPDRFPSAPDGAVFCDEEVGRPGKLRAPKPVRALRQIELELDPLTRGHAHLGDHVRRVRRAADAVGAQLGLANLGMHPKDQLDRVGKVELEIEVAGLAVGMLGDLAERVRHLRRNAADRAQQVPVQLEQALAGAMQARGDDLIGIEPESLGQGQRPDAGDLLGRSGGQVLGKPIDDCRIDAPFDQSVHQHGPAAGAAAAGIRAGSSNGSTPAESPRWRWPFRVASIRR